jgi:CDGSH-type Zn-finger protein
MADVKITVQLNGPYLVNGPIELVDQDGNNFTVQEGQMVAMCRCGRSDSKPFCDGTHRNKEPRFEAPTRAV